MRRNSRIVGYLLPRTCRCRRVRASEARDEAAVQLELDESATLMNVCVASVLGSCACNTAAPRGSRTRGSSGVVSEIVVEKACQKWMGSGV